MTSAVSSSACHFASRTAGLKPSAIREILKVTGSPDVISFAGGLPAPELFPIEETAARAARSLLAEDGHAYLTPSAYSAPKVGRNEPCPCGGGKSYEHCCLAKD